MFVCFIYCYVPSTKTGLSDFVSGLDSILILTMTVSAERHGPHFTGGTTQTQTPKLVSLQGPLLLREYRGMEFGKKKGGRGIKAGAWGRVGGMGTTQVGRTTDLKRAGLGGGRRQD